MDNQREIEDVLRAALANVYKTRASALLLANSEVRIPVMPISKGAVDWLELGKWIDSDSLEVITRPGEGQELRYTLRIPGLAEIECKTNIPGFRKEDAVSMFAVRRYALEFDWIDRFPRPFVGSFTHPVGTLSEAVVKAGEPEFAESKARAEEELRRTKERQSLWERWAPDWLKKELKEAKWTNQP